MLVWRRKSRAIAEFANDWIMYSTRFKRYMYFVSEVKPFPFTALDRAEGAVDADEDLDEVMNKEQVSLDPLDRVA